MNRKSSLLIGTSVLAVTLGYYASNDNQQTPTLLTSTPVEEQINFEVAKRAVVIKSPDEERVVQSYLDQLFDNRQMYGSGIDGWKSFAGFVYDPAFEKMGAAYSGNNLTPENSNNAYLNHKGGHLVASTPCMEPGEKGIVYVSRKFFEFAHDQDDILSGLDNEAYHAGICHTSMVHLPLTSSPSDPELMNIMNEIFSFDLQFKAIEVGKRKVSKDIVVSFIPGARVLFRELERVAQEGTARSHDAQVIYNLMLQQKTLPYFVDIKEIPSKRKYDLTVREY